VITINFTVLIQLINFIATICLLNILLIRPIRTIIIQRREKVGELETSIASFSTLAEERLANYESVLEKTRITALEARVQVRQIALDSAKDIVHDAERGAHSSLEDAHKRVKQEVKEAQTALQQDMQGFVDLVIKKIL